MTTPCFRIAFSLVQKKSGPLNQRREMYPEELMMLLCARLRCSKTMRGQVFREKDQNKSTQHVF